MPRNSLAYAAAAAVIRLDAGRPPGQRLDQQEELLFLRYFLALFLEMFFFLNILLFILLRWIQ